jgi:DNA polymerase-1
MRIALIDADVTAFATSAAAEKAIDWGDGMWTVHAFEHDVALAFTDSIDRIQEATGADKVILAFSDDNRENIWRKKVLPTYKSNRAGQRAPMLRKWAIGFAREHYETITKPTLEGDDVLGILATRKGNKDELVICTIDKDLKTIPGFHYNFGKRELFEVTEEEADRWHLFQTLTGDATDGYAGCPGIGPVVANRILDEDPSWDAVVKAYKKAGLGEEEALVQAQVARICRASDYDFKTKQVKLWNPN